MLTDEHWDVVVVGAGSAGAPLRRAFPKIQAAACCFSRPDETGAHPRPRLEMLSANPCAIIMEPEMQAAWQWPKLMARRTTIQEPRLYWRGRGLGGSSAMTRTSRSGASPTPSTSGPRRAAKDGRPRTSCRYSPPSKTIPKRPSPTSMEKEDRSPSIARRSRAGVLWTGRFGNAALDLGYPWHEDLNAAHGEGVACYPINNRLGRRVSTNEAYLEPARNRPNLTVVGDALVDHVTFNGTVASGVRVRLSGKGWTNLAASMRSYCAPEPFTRRASPFVRGLGAGGEC